MITFDEAFDRLISHEGGYSEDPRDSGNWTGGAQGVGQLKGTKFGIASSFKTPYQVFHQSLNRVALRT